MKPKKSGGPSFFHGAQDAKRSTTTASSMDHTYAGAEASSSNGTLQENQVRLKNALTGPLLPFHTHLFVNKAMHKPLINSVLATDPAQFNKLTSELDVNDDRDYEILKEAMILAAFSGAKAVIQELKKHSITLDSEILNVALLSGRFAGRDFDYFTSSGVEPTYNSIRYAILSGNAQAVSEVFVRNPTLKPAAEHLAAVSAAGNDQMLEILKNQGMTIPHGFNLDLTDHMDEVETEEYKDSPVRM